MSFSSEVKEELSWHMDSARHCQIAELSAILTMCGRILFFAHTPARVKMQTESLYVARKYAALLWKIFHLRGEVSVRMRRPSHKAALKKGEGSRTHTRSFAVAVKTPRDTMRILQACKLMVPALESAGIPAKADGVLLLKSCCRRSFIRGSFLVSGSISDPEKFYHFEIACAAKERAEQLKELFADFELDAKIVQRKSQFVVYIKEGGQIVDALNVMGATKALLNLENIRVVREVRNSVNRKVNCETANIHKTVDASVRQLEDIEYLRTHLGLEKLPEHLAQVAALRLDAPEATLKELGEMLDPPVSKSGVNHRLRRLSELAGRLRDGQ